MSFYDRADGFGHWAAIEKATGEFIGRFSLRPHDGERLAIAAPAGDAGEDPWLSGQMK